VANLRFLTQVALTGGRAPETYFDGPLGPLTTHYPIVIIVSHTFTQLCRGPHLPMLLVVWKAPIHSLGFV
jgi:hypothetical protein